MKYKTFKAVATTVVSLLICGSGWLTCQCVNAVGSASGSSSSQGVQTPTPAPIYASHSYTPPMPVQQVSAPVHSSSALPPSTNELRTTVENWLTANGDRQGRMRMNDIFPNASYRATAVRFPEESAVRFSNDSSQWSQIRFDLNRDGVDDEKWLLLNGHTYKREVLGSDGRTVTQTSYFNR